MSIIIPGVELPPIDEYLHLRIDGNGYVSMQISENQYVCELYDTDKKAIELPPHGRAIDADALKRAMYHEAFETDSPMQKWDSGCWIRYKLFERMEEAAPTIIPADREEDT